MTVITDVGTGQPVGAPEAPRHYVRHRMERSQAMVIGGAHCAALARALCPPIAQTVCIDDPYEAMQYLLDDPTDWCLCAADTALFASEADAASFLRLLCFENAGVPVVQFNAGGDEGPADLTLTPGPVAETAGAILELVSDWFPTAMATRDPAL